MTTWCQKLGPKEGADMEILTAGALVHDVGVPINRPNHFTVHTRQAEQVGLARIEYMKRFFARIEKELGYEA
jgi:HD superfamily phosphodiesterase